MVFYKNFFDFGLYPLVALYCAFALYGVLGFLLSAIYIVGSLFYIFGRSVKFTEPKGGWKTIGERSSEEHEKVQHGMDRDKLIHERKAAELYIYMYIMPLAILIILFFYFKVEDSILYISIFLLYFALNSRANILDESYRVELRLHDENFEKTSSDIKSLEEKLNDLKFYVDRLSNASGFDEKKISEIEDMKHEIQQEMEMYERIEKYKETNLNNDSREVKNSYFIDDKDSWEEIIWKWADAYKIPSEVIPRNKVDLLNVITIDLSPYSVNPILSQSSWGHSYRSNESNIDTIPKELFNLINLIELNLEHTNITEIPDGISNLIHLKDLSIVSTNITKLPEELVKLKKLENIKISNTKIEVIPSELKKLIYKR